MKFGVIQFPGSCDERDALHAVSKVGDGVLLWHRDRDLQGVDAIIVPGGFSYGDYLRAGALARFSPIMAEVERFAAHGGLVLGICNGFQVLCEAGLLPGALLPNTSLRFECRQVELEVVGRDEVDRRLRARRPPLDPGQAPDRPLLGARPGARRARGERPGRRSATSTGHAFNGAARDIAGVSNHAGNVVGLMPHPEHAVDPLTGSADGLKLFESAALVAA